MMNLLPMIPSICTSLISKKHKLYQEFYRCLTCQKYPLCEICTKVCHKGRIINSFLIIRVYGFSNGDDAHKPSLILSLEPSLLEEAIKNHELDTNQKNLITVELVLGMRYIHRHKFMHRDLKPSNILLSKKQHVRISDFGLAKEEDLETSRTKGVGTMIFMEPELFEENDEAKDYTSKVDVYSFGIILIFIVIHHLA